MLQYEDWLGKERADEKERAEELGQEIARHGDCTGCGAKSVELLVHDHCRACTQHHYGYALGEEAIGFAMVRMAARTALEWASRGTR